MKRNVAIFLIVCFCTPLLGASAFAQSRKQKYFFSSDIVFDSNHGIEFGDGTLLNGLESIQAFVFSAVITSVEYSVREKYVSLYGVNFIESDSNYCKFRIGEDTIISKGTYVNSTYAVCDAAALFRQFLCPFAGAVVAVSHSSTNQMYFSASFDFNVAGGHFCDWEIYFSKEKDGFLVESNESKLDRKAIPSICTFENAEGTALETTALRVLDDWSFLCELPSSVSLSPSVFISAGPSFGPLPCIRETAYTTIYSSSTPRTLSFTTDRWELASFTVTKRKAETDLLFRAVISTANGEHISQQVWSIDGVDYYAQSVNFDSSTYGILQYSLLFVPGADVGMGEHHVTFGYRAMNGGSYRPFIYYNPDTSQDLRLIRTTSYYIAQEFVQSSQSTHHFPQFFYFDDAVKKAEDDHYFSKTLTLPHGTAGVMGLSVLSGWNYQSEGSSVVWTLGDATTPAPPPPLTRYGQTLNYHEDTSIIVEPEMSDVLSLEELGLEIPVGGSVNVSFALSMHNSNGMKAWATRNPNKATNDRLAQTRSAHLATVVGTSPDYQWPRLFTHTNTTRFALPKKPDSLVLESFVFDKKSPTSTLIIEGALCGALSYAGNSQQEWVYGEGEPVLTQTVAYHRYGNAKNLYTLAVIAGHTATGPQTLTYRFFSQTGQSGVNPFLVYNPSSSDLSGVDGCQSVYHVWETESVTFA